MATLIGIVSKVIGQVFAVASDGTRRALVEGDRLFAGDQLVTGAEGAVAVHLQNGEELTLGRGSNLQMSPQLLAHQSPHVGTLEAVTPSEVQLTDVEQLQKTIAAGADPTQTAEATAAGPGSTPAGDGASGGGHTFVLLEEVGGRVDPTIGFPTAGFGSIPEFPEERHNADIQNSDGTPAVVAPPPTPVNHPVTLVGLSAAGGELTINEANLPNGSASNPGALTQNGTFSVSALDGLNSLSIGGINVITGGVAAGVPQSITTPQGNTLTITYDPATGVVSYSFTLNGSVIHPAGDGTTPLIEQITVMAGDSNGDTVTGTLDVNITDDVPKAVDDSNASTASETLLTLTGSVLPNDTQGADRIPVGPDSGPVIGGTFTGTYGTLVLNPNGTYTYTLNTSDVDFKALHGGGSGTETFAYTLTDADGDTSTANLVLQIHNNDDPVTMGGLNANGGELTVYEKNLGDGSSPDASAQTQSGTFAITALDGVTTLTVGGIAVVTNGVATGFPQSVTTPLGSTLTITGFNATTGVVSYSYALADNEAHPTANDANSLPEQFAVTVVDDNGTTANGTLDVNIVDDLPQGVNDSNASTASETLLTLNGNVLTNDVQGADRVTLGENVGPITPGTFAGTYGTLMLNANGTYTYTLNTSNSDFKALHGNGNGTETFAYTLTDADGDTSSANLVLNIHNDDDPVTLNVYGGELTVYEKNLSDGTNPNTPALTKNGTFTVTALDGLQTLDVGGIHVVAGGVTAGFPQTIVTALGNTLTITDYNSTTGVISYSYTLVDNETHPAANGNNSLTENFDVVATDTDGSTATNQINVNIIDDLPQAVYDSNASTASETLLTLNGNVLSNDVQGADRIPTGPNAGPITPGTFAGTYGTLVLNANGTYIYTLNTSNADFKALHGNGNGTETFAYTLTDADGDTSSANLVLQIHNNDDPVTLDGLNVNGGELTVYEKNLSDGTNPNTPALTQNGTFTVTALDGLQTLDVGGLHVVAGGVTAGFPQSIVTPLGSTLTITGFDATTGVVSYSYTLVDNETHPAANGNNSLTENFDVVATDTDGSTATNQINVNIIDDLPQAVYDSNASTASETLLTLNGNVLTNDVQGADRVTLGENVGPITPGTFAGTYGTLVLNANGTYTYTLNTSNSDFKALHGNGNGTETFAYTITDADGDISTANLVLNIHNNNDPVILKGLDVYGGELTVYEKNLSDGSSPDTPALTQSGTFAITALDGVQTLSVGGINVVVGGTAAGFPQSIVTPLGSTLTITGFNATTGVVSYSYTLADNEAHPTGNDANSLPEQFAVTVVDDNGTTANGTLDVNIIDDRPQGVYDSNAGTASETLLTLNGNVLSNDVQGADRIPTGPNAGPITPGTFAGTYGTLVLNANGTYTYTLNTSDAEFKALHGNGNGTETFAYTLTDADGDSSTANLVLKIHNNDDPVTLDGLNVYGGELTVYEKNLSDGTNPNTPALTKNGTFTVTALDGLQTLDVGGIHVVAGGVTAGFPQTIVTALGNTLTITDYNSTTGVISYSYTLVDNESHPAANGNNSLTENFDVVATDTDGSTATNQINVNIIDDLPQAVYDSNASTASETLLILNGNVLSNDVQGADRIPTGPNAGPITPGTFAGTYGALVLNANGTYTYTLNTSDAEFKALHGNGNGTETFAYTLTDADGDSSTANLVLNIHNDDDPVTLNGLNVYGGELTVYEKNLSDGSSPDTPALTQSGTFAITALDGVQTLSVGGIAVVTNGVTTGFPQSVMTPLGSTLTITGFNATTGVVSYSYTLADNEAHPTGNDANSLPEQFAVTVVDDNGTTANGTLDVNIIDDRPQGVYDSNASTASETLLTLNGNVLTNDVQGADRIPTGPSAGPITPGTFAGTYGTLVLNANGTYTYTYTLNTSDAEFKALHGNGNGTETFAYTLTDADGDSSTANLVLNIHNDDDPVTLNGLNVYGGELTVYEKNLSDGTNPNTPALTKNGTFTVTALDGLQTLDVGGIHVVAGGVTAGFPQTIVTALGNTLTITGYNSTTGVISYSYTLVDNETHPTADGANSLPENFDVVVTDTDGSTATNQINVNIIDDRPQGVYDSNASTASETLLTLNGNVLSNDVQGADRIPTGPSAGPITPGTFAGTYGTLVLNANGTYTYTLNTSNADFKALHGNGNGTETFAYTLTDADGDSSTANLVLNIHNDDDPVTLNGLNVYGGELTVYEKNLSDGTNPNTPALTQNGTFTVTALDGLQTLDVGGLHVVAGGVTAGFPQSIVTPLGSTLTITGFDATTGVVSYSYTLVDNETHPAANGNNSLTENFDVVATDTDGSTASGQINVNIVDDLPTAAPNTASAVEGATVNISVLGNDVLGADGPAVGGAVIGVRAGSNTATSAVGGLGNNINGTYGYLTLDAAGNAVYHSNPNSVGPAGATDTFTYTIRDSDGDESTTTITINVTDNALKAVIDQDVTVYEKALDLNQDGLDLAGGTVTGSDPGNTEETATGTLVGSVTGGSGTFTYSLVGSATGIYGQILLNADGTYTYTLTSAPKTLPNANDGPNTLSESFTYKATDALGNSTTSTIVVNIVDDVPKAVESDRSVAAVEIDSNLLIVLDISGSMADDSGVPGLSRLALAKSAISALLDKYDDLGDVKVQLVTFSSSATDRTSVWVDVATAKTLLASLTANGGTNYDAAVAMLQTAFNTSGKLTGAQNVGYFFSDGKPTTGQETGTADEAALKAFLDANSIKNYAIGLGSGVSNANLDPLAYDGSTHTNTNAVVVTDLIQLNSVLSGTVVGAPVTGTLLEGGTFGADGGFIKTLTVDGTTYTYDPKGNTNQGSLNFSGGDNHGTFNTVNNSISIATNNGGTLVVNLDTGEYNYTSQKSTAVVITENIGFTVSDNDGDLASSTLTVKVIPNAAPVAVDDHIITNVLSSNIVVPGELLLANDTDADKDPLTASPTSFNTGWVIKSADFTGTGAVNFMSSNSLADVRSSFTANTAAMTALLVINGSLGQVKDNSANDEDLITVKLKAGETLNLDHNLADGHITMEYGIVGGPFVSIVNGGMITASADGTYQIHITNIENTSGGNAKGDEDYQLTMTVNYAGAHDLTSDAHDTYTANDNHGGSDTAAVTISYQDGHTLTGTAGDDVLVAGTGNNVINAGDGNDVLTAGTGNNELHGGAGNDLLFSGIGNDLLDGGTGIDTANYAHATAGVTVDLNLATGQNTGGAGTDTLTGIENLVGSNLNDSLTGDNNSNIINGGLGDDILKGGGGDDFLIGGLGNNTLTGGAGADTFQWLKGNSGHDVVTDFTSGTDKLDLSQLLQGENGTTASLDDYLHFKVVGSGASVLTSIDVSAMAGATPNQTIDLAGVDLANHYGVTPGAGGVVAGGHDTATIINGMLNDHSLKVDTV